MFGYNAFIRQVSHLQHGLVQVQVQVDPALSNVTCYQNGDALARESDKPWPCNEPFVDL